MLIRYQSKFSTLCCRLSTIEILPVQEPPLNLHLECNDESTSLTNHLEHPAPAYVRQPNTSTPAVPTTHTKKHSDDYIYIINESPKSVKLKCIIMQDGVTSIQKRLKTSETKSHRLRRKVESLQTVVNTLKETHIAVRSRD